jgi:hypothetical protein
MGGMDWVKGKAGIMRVILEREVSNLKIDDLKLRKREESGVLSSLWHHSV